MVNAPTALQALRKLDERHPTLNSTLLALRLAVGDIRPDTLVQALTSEFGLTQEQAQGVRTELTTVLGPVLRSAPTPSPAVPATATPTSVVTGHSVPPSVPPPTPAAPLTSPGPSVPAAPTPVPTQPVGGFHAPEDATEIAMHRARITGFEAKPRMDPEASADAIAKEFKLAFPEEHLWARYRTLAISALKGLRRPFDVRDVLTRPTKIGGLALAPEVAERILRTFQERGTVPTPPIPPKPAGAAPAGAPARLVIGGKTMPALPSVPRRTGAVPPTPSAPRIPIPPVNLPVPPPALPRSAVPAPSFVTPFTRTPAAQARRSEPSGRRVVADVRQPKRTVGPVDELGLLTVDDLRRLDRDPEVAVEKLWGKFQNLSKDSFTLYTDGIRAWRRSPLYQLYVAMGTESLTTNRAVDVIANARLNQNLPTLSPKEFGIVADLSKRLRL